MTTNILNAFVQTDVDKKNQLNGECIIMKIGGPLVDMLHKIAPEGNEGAILDLQRQDQTGSFAELSPKFQTCSTQSHKFQAPSPTPND
jgi:hypothetical protein